MEQNETMNNRKVEYFPESVDTKDKMLDENGRAIQEIRCPEEGYAILYNFRKHNYETRELDGDTIYALTEEVAYRNGVRHGKYVGYELTTSGPIGIDFYPREAVEGHYINGKKTGWWYYYGEDGSVTRKLFVKDKDITAEHNKANNKGNFEIMQAAKRSASHTL